MALKILGMPVLSLQKPGKGYMTNSIDSAGETAELLSKLYGMPYSLHGIKDARLLKRVLETAGQSHLFDEEGLERTSGIMSHIQAKPKNRRS